VLRGALQSFAISQDGSPFRCIRFHSECSFAKHGVDALPFSHLTVGASCGDR
jgi:hypothetical protein